MAGRPFNGMMPHGVSGRTTGAPSLSKVPAGAPPMLGPGTPPTSAGGISSGPNFPPPVVQPQPTPSVPATQGYGLNRRTAGQARAIGAKAKAKMRGF